MQGNMAGDREGGGAEGSEETGSESDLSASGTLSDESDMFVGGGAESPLEDELSGDF